MLWLVVSEHECYVSNEAAAGAVHFNFTTAVADFTRKLETIKVEIALTLKDAEEFKRAEAEVTDLFIQGVSELLQAYQAGGSRIYLSSYHQLMYKYRLNSFRLFLLV
jgi:hypothetical protein